MLIKDEQDKEESFSSVEVSKEDSAPQPNSETKQIKLSSRRSNNRYKKRLDARKEEVNVDVDSLVPNVSGSPLIFKRSQHSVSRANIDTEALRVLKRLYFCGYKGFLVGGSVRDLLLGKKPKDFDIATDASPEAVRRVFRNSRIIGRRFRLNQVYFADNKIIEVSTFRSASQGDSLTQPSMLGSDNTYGDPQSDALRRDLTINGLFYDLRSFSIIDYVGGMKDLKDKVIRIIGQPEIRFQEDPVRILRVIRHAARTGFRIEENTFNAIAKYRDLIKECPASRVSEEMLRELRGGSSCESFKLLFSLGLLPIVLPSFYEVLSAGDNADENGESQKRVCESLAMIDSTLSRGEAVPTPIILLSLSIGKFSEKVFTEFEHVDVATALGDYWRVTPENIGNQGSEETNRFLDSIKFKANASSKRLHRRRPRVLDSNHLNQIIQKIYSGLIITRHDREQMEHLLVARRMLFMPRTKSFSRQVEQSAFFYDALKLLEFTSHDKKSKEVFQSWTDYLFSRQRKKHSNYSYRTSLWGRKTLGRRR